MAFLDTKQFQFGRQNVWATTVGAADLPTTNSSGVIQVGDWVINLSGSIGQPDLWVCTAQTSSSVTWTSGAVVGGGTSSRTSATSTTLLSTDRYLFQSAASTVTLPAPTSTLAQHAYDIKALAQPVTITAASGGNLDSTTLGSQTLETNQTITLYTDGLTNWYTVGRDPAQNTRTATASTTFFAGDKIIFCPAGNYTLAAVAGMSVGYIQIVHATASSVTLTPGSGTVNGAAAATLAANANAQIFCDGTNWFTAN